MSTLRQLIQLTNASTYSQLAMNISSAFHQTFFNSTEHCYATGSQAANVFALEMSAVPLTEEQPVIEYLINDIRRRNNHTSSGEVSLPTWFRMLSHYGQDEIVYDFLSRTDSPSYGYAIMHGATSLTEDWDGPVPSRGQGLSSQNHFMFGAVDEWLTRSLAGIQQPIYSNDYRIIHIKPSIIPHIHHVKGTYRTTRGWIHSQWNYDEDYLSLDVTIPCGSIAYVYLPGINATTDYGTFIHFDQIKSLTIFKIPSGNYHFNSIFIRSTFPSLM